MEDVLLVVAVVVGTFLLAVSRVVCGVKVQKDTRRRSVFAPLPEVELAQRFGHTQAGSGVGCILKTRDSRLACQVRVRLRQPPADQLQQRITPQGIRVVLVLVAARYLQDSLPDQRLQRMP